MNRCPSKDCDSCTRIGRTEEHEFYLHNTNGNGWLLVAWDGIDETCAEFVDGKKFKPPFDQAYRLACASGLINVEPLNYVI